MYSITLLPKRQITQFHLIIFVISMLVIYHAYFFTESCLIYPVLKPFDVISKCVQILIVFKSVFIAFHITGPLYLREFLPISFLYLGISNCKGFLTFLKTSPK